MADIDFEAEGLLEGLEGRAREGRLKLLEELSADGVPLDELKWAAEEGRLALLPVERVLGGADRRYSATEIAERAGIELDVLQHQWRALGMALLDDDEPGYGEQDLLAARRLQALREAGVPDEGIVEVGRLLGMSMSQLAAANRRLIAEAFVREDDTEYELAKRFELAAQAFRPVIGETLPYVLNLHLLEQIRHDAVNGELTAATQQVTVAFADLVGFTQLGETLAPEQLGTVTGRLAELASEAVEPPVRLVKMIGDAAMYAGPEPAPVLDAAITLVESALSEGEDFPVLRAGVASGQAFPRAGDWYGHPVNLASRITGVAYPSSVLASEEVRDALADDYDWSFAGRRRLKGIEQPVKLHRARRLGEGEAAGERSTRRRRRSAKPE
jgi:adenylate cyclase